METYERYNHGQLLNDRYLKVEDISEGSYGLVSLAKDTKKENKLVAVKYIYPIDFKRAKHLKELSKSGRRATSSPAKLRSNVGQSHLNTSGANGVCEESNKEIQIHEILGVHPNITNLVDHFGSCLVLEYCPRGDLYEAIQGDFGPSTSQDIKDVFLQILNALTYCHAKLVYHRDLKPENILIAEDWLIKVCDWGLATTQQKITNRSEFDIGSERYMAPELFDNDLTYYDASKVDLWSIGIILLTLVFRKNPFQVANYTDKRFLQFSANREALFDFFSAMSGELFSALRYSLNIDPSNRDLASLHHEIEKMKFFTMDEEYWAEHSDDGEEEDLGYEAEEEEEDRLRVQKKEVDSEDEMFKFDKEKEPATPLDTPVLEVLHPADELTSLPKKTIHFPKHLNVDVTDSDATTAASAKDDDREDMPYNRRADALLSPITGAHPIPIGGNNRIRNTRKPFGVASYKVGGRSNQNACGSFGSRFRREDFFTPRSVVNHYMDKYGEQKEQRDQRSDKRRKWNRGRKRQSWKKKGSDNNGGRPSSIHGSHVHSQSHNSQSQPQGSHNSQPSQSNSHHYRKHHRNRRSRNEGIAVSSSSYQHPNSIQAALSTSHQSSHHASSFHHGVQSPVQMSSVHSATQTLPVITSPSLPSAAHIGRHLPRHVRSPYKSPLSGGVGVLTEEIDHLALNDDEVFHLEDDYGVVESDPQLNYSAPYRSYDAKTIFGNNANPNGANNPNGLHSASFQGFPAFYSTNQPSNYGSQLGSQLGGSHSGSRGGSFGGSLGALAVAARPSRRHLVDREAKYVPPNRRGSHSAAAREKRRSVQPGAHYTIHQTLEDSARSVPQEEWLLRKEWR